MFEGWVSAPRLRSRYWREDRVAAAQSRSRGRGTWLQCVIAASAPDVINRVRAPTPLDSRVSIFCSRRDVGDPSGRGTRPRRDARVSRCLPDLERRLNYLVTIHCGLAYHVVGVPALFLACWLSSTMRQAAHRQRSCRDPAAARSRSRTAPSRRARGLRHPGARTTVGDLSSHFLVEADDLAGRAPDDACRHAGLPALLDSHVGTRTSAPLSGLSLFVLARAVAPRCAMNLCARCRSIR